MMSDVSVPSSTFRHCGTLEHQQPTMRDVGVPTSTFGIAASLHYQRK
jgi:hypothetical protein